MSSLTSLYIVMHEHLVRVWAEVTEDWRKLHNEGLRNCTLCQV